MLGKWEIRDIFEYLRLKDNLTENEQYVKIGLRKKTNQEEV